MNKELLSCPFCDGIDLVYNERPDPDFDEQTMFFMSCLDCGTDGPYGPTREEGEEAWNWRNGVVAHQ